MTVSRLTIVRAGLPAPANAPGEQVIHDHELRSVALRNLLRYEEGRLLTHRLDTDRRPARTALLLRAASRGRCWVEDASGSRREFTWGLLARWLGRFAVESWRRPALVRAIEARVRALEVEVGARRGLPPEPGLPCLYLRPDLNLGVQAGGSVAHTAGVLNHLAEHGPAPVLVTVGDVPTLRADVEVQRLTPSDAFWNFRELPALLLNDVVQAEVMARLRDRRVGFVYQRHSLGAFAGIGVSRALGVPLVLEYNGSALWCIRNWTADTLRYEQLHRRIERLNQRAADLVVVVSRVLRDELVAAGVEDRRILVNPNGVDPERYRPGVDGSEVRRQLGLEDRLVVGFIGSFGPWHGAEVLADAFARVWARRPDLRPRLRLLLIGDGARLGATRERLRRGGVADAAVCTGLVSQDSGPAHLAACDILVSPQVPNPDGSRFFGSPTKVFEYMAMGRAIVASALEQIGEVLEHGRTAWLVEPGSSAELAAGLERLVDDEPLRAALGAAARERAVARHTWSDHTRRIVEAVLALPAPVR